MMERSEFIELLEHTSEGLKTIKKEMKTILTENSNFLLWPILTSAHVNLDKIKRLMTERTGE